MNGLKCMTGATLALLLTSCAVFGPSSGVQNRDKMYLKAKSEPALRIPPGLSSSQFQNSYPVSDRTDPDSTKTPNLVPPGA
ncbi:MAG TPA: hypothetical protein VFU82_02035 [Gammaproteobacteria bacterium]|jgi:uncharacterized lipoprotein|nr:hypothetical protein [Gammaproteobacteria bacterium]